MTDLTKIEKPFGLLDSITQEMLRLHGGPYEYFCRDGWKLCAAPTWVADCTYRVKPQPPKPREWWLVGAAAYRSKDHARNVQIGLPPGWEIIHVREVLPE